MTVKLDNTQEDYLFSSPSEVKYEKFSVISICNVAESNVKYAVFGYQNGQLTARICSIYESGYCSETIFEKCDFASKKLLIRAYNPDHFIISDTKSLFLANLGSTQLSKLDFTISSHFLHIKSIDLQDSNIWVYVQGNQRDHNNLVENYVYLLNI